jgi:hypothetical protein
MRLGPGTLRGPFFTLFTAGFCTAAALAAVGCAGANAPPVGGDDDDDDEVDAGEPPPRADADPLAPDADPDEPDAESTGGDDADIDPPDDPDADVTNPPTDPDLIDDLNDGNDNIRNVGGRVGVWFTFHDETDGGVQTPPGDFTPTMPGADGMGFAAKTTGQGFAEWGAGIGFDLNTPSSATKKGKYNASAYTGVKFKAKAKVAIPIRFSIQTAAVLEKDLGGTCTPSTVEHFECDDVHGKAISLTTGWLEYTVPFAQLAQENWGLPALFDKATLTAIQFQIGPGLVFDISVDDVRFY